jgi:hypothetical protein
MAFKSEVLNSIEKEFPGLEKSKFYLFGEQVKFEGRDKLLPYLILKNTIDNKKRGIITFQKTSSDYYKLTPIFVAIGVGMRTQVNVVKPNEKWKNENFIYNGTYVQFEKFDLDSNLIYLKSGTKSFSDNANYFKYSARNSNLGSKARIDELINYIESESLEASITLNKHLLKLKTGEHNLQGGVLVITRKGKFKEILNSFRIDNKRLSELMDIRVTKWNSNSEKYSYPSVFGIAESSSQPLVLVAGYDEFGAVNDFIKEFPHISSVVFDDSADFKQKLNSSKFDRFKDKFIDSDQFRDAYFIMDESDMDKRDFIEGLVKDLIPVYSWISTFADINDSFELNSLKFSLVNHIKQVPLNVSRECFQELLSNGYIDLIFPFFKEFMGFVKRWNSFYDVEHIEHTILQLSESLENLIIEHKERFFFVEKLTERIKDQIRNFQIDNLKFERFKLELENYNIDVISKVYMMSENTTFEDQNYVIENIPSRWSDKIEFIGFDERFKFVENSVIFAFGSHRNFVAHILHNYLGPKIHFILDCKDFWYFRLTYFRTVKLLKNILDPNKRRELMNLPEDIDCQDESVPYPILNGLLNELNKVCEQVEKNSPDSDLEGKVYNGLDFLEFLEGEEKETSENKDYGVYNERKIGLRIIGMDDGSSKIYEKSKYVFALDSFDEDVEFASMKDAVDGLKKRVDDLNEGDYILELPEDKPNDLQKFVENQIESSFVLKNLNYRSESWRKALNMIYEELGCDMSKFKSLLGKHIQRSEQTFKNWLTGFTIVPDSDYRDNQDVLKTISDLVNTDSRFKHIKFIFDENLRGQMKKMKSIKVNAPKMLLKRAVYKRINLRVEIEDTDQREFIKSLSEMIKVKQIKTIQDI